MVLRTDNSPFVRNAPYGVGVNLSVDPGCPTVNSRTEAAHRGTKRAHILEGVNLPRWKPQSFYCHSATSRRRVDLFAEANMIDCRCGGRFLWSLALPTE